MDKLNKQNAIELLLKKRFGVKKPEEVPSLQEVNIFTPLNEEDDNPLGLCVELVICEKDNSFKKEEYQIAMNGIIYSWGNSPVIDKRSLEKPPINN